MDTGRRSHNDGQIFNTRTLVQSELQAQTQTQA